MPQPIAQAGKKLSFAEEARAELNRHGVSDMDIDNELLFRRQRAKRALRAKNNVKS